jgi:hypothetical protein
MDTSDLPLLLDRIAAAWVGGQTPGAGLAGAVLVAAAIMIAGMAVVAPVYRDRTDLTIATGGLTGCIGVVASALLLQALEAFDANGWLVAGVAGSVVALAAMLAGMIALPPIPIRPVHAIPVAAAVASVAMVFAAVHLARTDADGDRMASAPALWILPDRGSGVEIGAANHGASAAAFALPVFTGGSQAAEWRIDLAPGDAVTIAVPSRGPRDDVTAELHPVVSRDVPMARVWLMPER